MNTKSRQTVIHSPSRVQSSIDTIIATILFFIFPRITLRQRPCVIAPEELSIVIRKTAGSQKHR